MERGATSRAKTGLDPKACAKPEGLIAAWATLVTTTSALAAASRLAGPGGRFRGGECWRASSDSCWSGASSAGAAPTLLNS